MSDSESKVGASSSVLRVVRLARVFRLAKVSRYLTWFRIFSTSLRQSVAPLGETRVQSRVCEWLVESNSFEWQESCSLSRLWLQYASQQRYILLNAASEYTCTYYVMMSI